MEKSKLPLLSGMENLKESLGIWVPWISLVYLKQMEIVKRSWRKLIDVVLKQSISTYQKTALKLVRNAVRNILFTFIKF